MISSRLRGDEKLFSEPECDAPVALFKDDLFGCNHNQTPAVLDFVQVHEVNLLRVNGFQDSLIVIEFVFQDSSDELEGYVAFAFGLPTEWPEQVIVDNHLKILWEFFLPFGSTCAFRLSRCFGFRFRFGLCLRRLPALLRAEYAADYHEQQHRDGCGYGFHRRLFSPLKNVTAGRSGDRPL